PSSGQAYLNVALDYGLQGAQVNLCGTGSALTRYNWAVNGSLGGLDAVENTNPSAAHGDVAIANCTAYTFGHSAGSGPVLQASVENLNQFSACTDPADIDCDGIANALDECPYYAGNAVHADVDLNGRGDACECGDQDGDGRLTVSDIVAVNQAIFIP